MDKGRGYVDTVAADDRRLMVYYTHEDHERDVLAEIRVLQEFAAAWTRGDLGVNGKEPSKDTQPCDILICGSTHFNQYTQ
ncbi:hypothetical protein J3458_009220 [Metarhizium acridum]|uniref:uncharacterized protein n=1 Tax=Metarhizium acridum TaxID=92637 RepID=UPI001C6AED58|nr:hypothetical protein J3458_009220 [Metarhizium acridum]